MKKRIAFTNHWPSVWSIVIPVWFSIHYFHYIVLVQGAVSVELSGNFFSQACSRHELESHLNEYKNGVNNGLISCVICESASVNEGKRCYYIALISCYYMCAFVRRSFHGFTSAVG